MKLKEIIDSASWEEVSQVLQKEYEEDWNKSSFGFENVFNRLKQLEPVDVDDYEIVVYEAEYLLGGKYTGVSFLKDGEYYSTSFTPWVEWLGTHIDQESLNKYEPHEIVGHCLWEMTYYGFSEIKIEESKKNILNAFTEAIEEINKKLRRG